MSTNERDTHFQGFAKLLLEDLGYDISQLMDETADSGDYEGHMRLIIAQRAYDFLVSSHYHTAMLATWEESKERVALVPDMTEWPPTTAE